MAIHDPAGTERISEAFVDAILERKVDVELEGAVMKRIGQMNASTSVIVLWLLVTVQAAAAESVATDDFLDIRGTIRVAHDLGMKICIKPHLAHRRSGFSWRGEIAFKKSEEWERIWKGYAVWITALAEACKQADLFVVGTELDRTVQHEAEWRDLIRQVRERTEAPITFASNWDAFEKVPFWDALDLVRIQSYFPISNEPNLSRQALETKWTSLAKRLAIFSKRVEKKIVLTELGYNQSFSAASEPWTYAVDAEAESLQLRCLSVALKPSRQSPRLQAAFCGSGFRNPDLSEGIFNWQPRVCVSLSVKLGRRPSESGGQRKDSLSPVTRVSDVGVRG